MKWCLCLGVVTVGLVVTGCSDSEVDPVAGISGGGKWDKQIVQYGRMHEVIGQQKHHGRILLGDAIKRPNLVAVGALETLAGEVTILDGVVYASAVDSPGHIAPLASPNTLEAALLVGSHVTRWSEHVAGKTIANTGYDTFVESAANEAGIDTSKPFVFTITGELRNVHVHVIHGACPVHAKRSGKTLPKEQEPYSGTFATLQGTLVGVFAKNAAGKITHPGNSTHTHVVFTDPKTGRKLTGHVESAGVSVAAVLRLPR